ncbi:MAG: 30S ribosomal protein S6 [Actinomycetota bacterium]|nr:30S ribosomal protein S6 [Actinomycetota bacterium]
MRPYEVMVILDAGLEEDVIRATIDRTTKLITDGGGAVGKVDRWGRRRFAYEVHHKSEGYYAVFEVTADPAVLAKVDRMLGLADEVIRHKVIRLPEKVAGRTPRPAPSAPTPVAATTTNGA